MNKEKVIENKDIITFDPNSVKKRFVFLFTIVGCLSLLGFGIYNLYIGQTILGYGEIGCCLIGLLNIIIVYKFKRITIGINIILLVMFILLIFLLISGGIDGTGVFWFFTFPALAFFLNDRDKGLIWIMLLVIAAGAVGVLSYLNYVTISIPFIALRQLLLSFLVVSLIIYFYEDTNEKAEKLIRKQNSEVAKAVNELGDEIAVRTASERKLSKLVDEFEDKNELLEKTKKAVINLLEDVEIEKLKTDEESKKLNTILESIGDGVFVVDTDQKILLINPATLNLAGITKEEAIGKYYKDVLNFKYEESEVINDKFIVDALRTGEIQSMSNHTVLEQKNGRKIFVSDSAAPLKDADGKVTGCVVVFRDVSKEREIDKAKTEFVSLASHQLRTPLSAMNWYGEMLLNGDAGELNDQQKDFVKEITDGNQRMIDLVNSLLNVSRIDLGTFTIIPVLTSIQEIADSVVKELEIMRKTKKIHFEKEYDEIEKINIDPQLTRIIFQNLLSNAIKYTPDSGDVSLTVKKVKENLLITVSDSGYGIPKDEQIKIFQKLYRADNVKAKNTEGTGLGLYIVKSILDASGGRIWFESDENKGSKFFVELPLSGMKSKEGSRTLN